MKEKAPTLSFACPKLWESMEGSETSRFCEACGHDVHNLSLLDRETRLRLMEKAKTGRVCGVYIEDLEGNLVTAESESELRKKMHLLRRAALAAGALALSSCGNKTPDVPLLGVICPPEEGK